MLYREHIQNLIDTPSVRHIKLEEDLHLNGVPLLLRQGDSERIRDFDLNTFEIIQNLQTADAISYNADTMLEMNQNINTRWKFHDGNITGGKRGIHYEGGYGLTIENIWFDENITCLELNLALMSRILGCRFRAKDVNVRISTGGAPGANAANSQPNSTTMDSCLHKMQPGCRIGIIVHSTNNFHGRNLIFEGGGIPEHLISFQGSSTHARNLRLVDTHVEFKEAPTRGLFYSEISNGNMIIDGLIIQSHVGMCLYELKNQDCKLVTSNVTQVPDGSYAVVPSHCDISVANSAPPLYRPEFWRRGFAPDSETGFPQFKTLYGEFRKGNPFVDSGEPPVDGDFDVNSFVAKLETNEIEKPFELNGQPFLAIWSGSVQEFVSASALLCFGQKLWFAGYKYNSICLHYTHNNTKTMGVLQFKIRTPEGYFDTRLEGQPLSAGIAIDEHFTAYIYFDGEKFKAGKFGGNSIEFATELKVTKDLPTTVLVKNREIWPSRPNGGAITIATSKVVVYEGVFTPNEISTACEFLSQVED